MEWGAFFACYIDFKYNYHTHTRTHAGTHTHTHVTLIQYNTIELYCLYVEKFAFWLVIYIKTFNTVNNKTSTTQ